MSSNCMNFRYMSKTEMRNNIVSLRASIKQKDRRISHLERQIQADPRITAVSEDVHDDLLSIMQNHNH